MQGELDGISPPDRVVVAGLPMDKLVARAVTLLQENCPPEGYYVAFSGGKDSCAIKKLCELAQVKFDAWYNNTTIDPPELIHFIKREHADVKWDNPKVPLLTMMANECNGPPHRTNRWCCRVYKEHGGEDRCKMMGVRAA